MMHVLGMPLDAALAILKERGITPQIVQTRAPRGASDRGTLRVLRFDEAEKRLYVARFQELITAEGTDNQL